MRVYAALSNVASPGGHAAHISGFVNNQNAFEEVLIVSEPSKAMELIKKLHVSLLVLFHLIRAESEVYLRASPIFLLVIFVAGKLRLIKTSRIFWEINGIIDIEANLGGHRRFLAKIQGYMEEYCYERVNKFVYVSDGIRRHYEDKYPTLADRGKVFENGYPSILEEVRERRKDVSDVIGYIGLYTKWQDFESCCSIVNSITKIESKKMRMIGSGQELSAWKAQGKKYSIDFEWLPPYSYQNIGDAYKLITIGLVPDLRYSLGEQNSSPIKLVEYAASGVLPLLVKNKKLYHPITFEELDINSVLALPNSEREAINQEIYKGRSWEDIVQHVEAYCFNCDRISI